MRLWMSAAWRGCSPELFFKGRQLLSGGVDERSSAIAAVVGSVTVDLDDKYRVALIEHVVLSDRHGCRRPAVPIDSVRSSERGLPMSQFLLDRSNDLRQPRDEVVAVVRGVILPIGGTAGNHCLDPPVDGRFHGDEVLPGAVQLAANAIEAVFGQKLASLVLHQIVEQGLLDRRVCCLVGWTRCS